MRPFVDWLLAELEFRGWSRSEAARRGGLSASTMDKVIGGFSNPGLHFCESMARAYSEVYNDLDGQIVNLFRVMRDPMQARELVRQVKLTPYARAEFETSYLLSDDPIEQARRTLLRAFAGHSSTGAS